MSSSANERSSASKSPCSSSCSSSTKSSWRFAAFASASSRNAHASGTGCENARSHAIDAAERPKERAIAAAVASGSSVQLRMRPSEHGSTTSAGSASLKILIRSVNSTWVSIEEETACLFTANAVAPMPEELSSFQIGPELPSTRPYSTVSRCRW